MAKETTKTTLQSEYNFNDAWEELLENKVFVNAFLSDVLVDYITKQRWYGGKASKIKYIELSEYFRIQQHGEVYYGLILEVNFKEAFYQHYFLEFWGRKLFILKLAVCISTKLLLEKSQKNLLINSMFKIKS